MVSLLVLSIVSFAFAQTNILSPLKQMRSGIAIKDIQCKDNLKLVVRTLYGLPVCVKPSSIQPLTERGIVIPLSNTTYEGVIGNHLQNSSWIFESRIVGERYSKNPSFPIDNHTLSEYPAIKEAMKDADICYSESQKIMVNGTCTVTRVSNCAHRIVTITMDQANSMLSNPLFGFSNNGEVNYNVTFLNINNGTYYVNIDDYQPARNYEEIC